MGKKRTWFPHLHIHDEHSIKDGCSKVETYADICGNLGGTALAITNHGQLAGMARQYFACKDRGIKPIFGVEAYVNEHRQKPVPRLVTELRAKNKKAKLKKPCDKLARADAFLKEHFRPSSHAIILAKTHEGYRNLVRMSTDSWLNGFYYVPRTDTKFLEEHAEGLIYSTACIGGYIPRLARTDFDAAVKEARRLQKIFVDGFYVELMITEYFEQRHTNEVMMRLAHAINAPMIITCDVHYAHEDDGLAQDVLLLMRDGKTIKDKEAGEGVWQFEAKDLWWRTLEDVVRCWKEMHSDYMDKEVFFAAIKQTYKVADEIEDITFDTSLKLPGVFEEPERQLRQVVADGFRYRVDRGLIPSSGHSKRAYLERAQTELKVIQEKGFSEYFLILQDITNYARNSGARMAPGRGSAGGSLISYLCRITDVDPIRFNLLFERFLDVTRPDPPDIDLDFSPQHRDGIKQYIQDRYPATATIGNFATFKPRAILQDVGAVFGIERREMQKLTKPLGTSADNKTWDEIFQEWPEIEAWAEENPKAFSVVKILKGMISHRGKNAAGVLIAPQDALSEIPMITESTGQVVTAFPDSQGDGVDYKGREITRLGYLKMDILGSQNLNVAEDAVEIVSRDHGQDIDLSALPLDDEPTLEVAASADIPGIFQLDTSVTRPILKYVGADAFMDLVMVTALCRPGPLRHSIHRIYAKLKKDDSWRDDTHPALRDLLADSRGLMILQEDVMHVVRALGGLSMTDSYKVMKIGAKKLSKEAMDPWKVKFIDGGVELGYSRDELEEVWSKIVTFSEYAFNKAHSVAYMITAYRQLYMLAHHPVAYFAALLANTARAKKTWGGSEKLVDYMRAAMSRGIKVLPPCVMKSGFEFDAEGDSVRYGLSKIKGVASGAQAVIDARPFASLEEFFGKVKRRDCNSRVVKALIAAGAFDEIDFDLDRGAEPIPYRTGIERRNSVLARYEQLRKSKGEPDEFTPTVLLANEREATGLALSWWSSNTKDELRREYDLWTIRDALSENRNRFSILVESASVRTHNSRRGTMAFLKVADETGELDNITIWAEQWKRHKADLKPGGLAIIYLQRKRNQNERYGKWSYYLDEERTKSQVLGVRKLLRRRA